MTTVATVVKNGNVGGKERNSLLHLVILIFHSNLHDNSTKNQTHNENIIFQAKINVLKHIEV